jgi:hypothetical protein
MLYSIYFPLSVWIFGIAETGIARGRPPGTTTEVQRVGFPSAGIRFVSQGIQAGRHFWSTHEVRSPRRRKGHLGGDTERRLWQPRILTTLVSKAFRQAFYWPTALGDAKELIRRCQG